jgi:hypothetical protein
MTRLHISVCSAILLAGVWVSPISAQDNRTATVESILSLVDSGQAQVIVLFNGQALGGAEALISKRVSNGVGANGGILVGDSGLGYTCTGEGNSGKCTCGPTDPCAGMIDACKKLGGPTTTCDNETKTCTCKY